MITQQSDIDELVTVWRAHCDAIADWRTVVDGTVPKETGNGPVYELPNPLENRPHESFAICDMRTITVSEPHYHPADNWEFYFVLAGAANVVVGEKEHHVKRGDTVIIPPDTAHFTLPGPDFVIAVVSNPPFTPGSYITLAASDESRLEVDFDLDQFKRLAAK